MIGRAARGALVAGAFATLAQMVGSGAAAATSVTELGPQVAPARPQGAYVGLLAVTPEHGPAGTLLAVTADGLPADQELDLVWYTVDGRWNVGNGEYRGRTYAPVAYRIARLGLSEPRSPSR